MISLRECRFEALSEVLENHIGEYNVISFKDTGEYKSKNEGNKRNVISGSREHRK